MTLAIDENTPRTEWISARNKPVRDGFYETRFSADQTIELREFRKGAWYAQYAGDVAYEMLSLFGRGEIHFGECWRGLAENPDA